MKIRSDVVVAPPTASRDLSAGSAFLKGFYSPVLHCAFSWVTVGSLFQSVFIIMLHILFSNQKTTDFES